jgi:hypothetical protein
VDKLEVLARGGAQQLEGAKAEASEPGDTHPLLKGTIPISPKLHPCYGVVEVSKIRVPGVREKGMCPTCAAPQGMETPPITLCWLPS